MLYPTFDFRNKFHVDHIHPKSLFTTNKLRKLNIHEDDIEVYKENVNNLGNLQLLEGQLNIEKNDKEFNLWISQEYYDDNMKNDYMQNVDLSISNFKEFIEKRNNIIRLELSKNLK